MKVFNTYSIASSTILLISVIPYTLTSAFTPLKTATNYSILKATSTSFDPLNLIDNDEKSSLSVTSPSVSSDPLQNGIGIRSLVSTSALLFLCPIVALAEEAEDYEYGAVGAPIGIAWFFGVLAIATSFLPLLLKGGEEALEQQRKDEKGSFGRGQDVLTKKGKGQGRKKR